MKSITSPLFNENLYSNDSRSHGTNVSYYNGSISGMDWKVSGVAHLEGNVPSDKFNISYSYDKHDNMLSLSRYGNVGTTNYVVDDLTLSIEVTK